MVRGDAFKDRKGGSVNIGSLGPVAFEWYRGCDCARGGGYWGRVFGCQGARRVSKTKTIVLELSSRGTGGSPRLKCCVGNRPLNFQCRPFTAAHCRLSVRTLADEQDSWLNSTRRGLEPRPTHPIHTAPTIILFSSTYLFHFTPKVDPCNGWGHSTCLVNGQEQLRAT